MKCKTTPEIAVLENDTDVFVFGSNLSGAHLGGAARHAYMNYGAKWGTGIGMTGRSFAFPTLGFDLEKLPFREGKWSIESSTQLLQLFVENYYKTHHFIITKLGCGIAGFKIEEMAPFFSDFLDYKNVSLPIEFIEYIRSKTYSVKPIDVDIRSDKLTGGKLYGT